jgi:hypothetical protein
MYAQCICIAKLRRKIIYTCIYIYVYENVLKPSGTHLTVTSTSIAVPNKAGSAVT